MSDVDLVSCPNCSAPMERIAIQGTYNADLALDVCFPCHVMWFDRRESIQLSPRGTIDLFKILHEHEEDPRHALAARMECPRCRRRLSLAQDIGKAGRFTYYNCPADEGRLTPFSEFLKEKQFVRQLTPLEQAKLKAEVKQVACSGCGATVDLARGFKCEHCGSPLTVLDADAVEKTLRELEAADAKRPETKDPTELLAREHRARALATMEKMRIDRNYYRDEQPGHFSVSFTGTSGNMGIDLLAHSIGKIFGLK